MRCIRIVPMIFFGLAAVGCGTQGQVGDLVPASTQSALGSDSDVITDATFEAVIAEKEFDDRSKAPECLALRGEINVLRAALLAKAEWLSLVKTQAWETLTKNYDAYTAANCPAITAPVTEIGESCAAARASVIQDWSDVANSPEYQVVEKHDALGSLLDKWKRAKAANCIAF